ncbi:MAG: transporter substrate-binding domain-containing protein [Gammaproteobacteria bacterium]|nr:transporter substrate-binding domain-containing protein [Gammaproteobacteria bacterium]
MNTQGTMQGLDIDIITALCQQMKVKCHFVNAPWDSLIPGLKLGKFDVIFGAMNITIARAKQVAFTQPYYFAQARFVARKNPGFTLDKKSLRHKTMGVQLGNTMQFYLQHTYGDTIKIKLYGSIQQAFLDLTAGRIDAVFSDQPVISAWLQDGNNKNYAFLKHVVHSEKYFAAGYGIAVRKGNDQLLAKLNHAINAIKKNGVYKKIIARY